MSPGRRLSVAAAAAAVAAAACSGGRAVAPTLPASDLRVGLHEYEVVASPAAARAGTVTLRVTNAGASAHDLVVNAGAETRRLPSLSPGTSATLRVTGQAGQPMVLWCSLPGHRAQGMQLEVDVAPAR